MEVYNLIEDLVVEIKKMPVYQDFKEKSQDLNEPEVKVILEEYQRLKQKKADLKKYDKYLDLTELNQEIIDIRLKMKESKIINDYYQAYYQINEYLNEITSVIFKNISDDIGINEISI